MKPIQIKSNSESDDQISDLQDFLLVQELMAPDVMYSKCSKNETTSCGKGKHSAQNVIKKNNDYCLRDADGHKFSLYELYFLFNIEQNNSYLKKLGLGGSSILKRESVCKKRGTNS